MTLVSEYLTQQGFVHGFSTREGGVSQGPYASLNLGRVIGDDEAAVEENHRRFAEFVGYPRVFELSQVHGSDVREVFAHENERDVRAEEGDALIAREPGVAVGIRSADCVPILLAHPESGAAAAVHAGWRGVEAGIVSRTLAALSVPGHQLIALVGPHIRAASFEVGEDVAERLAASSSAKDVIQRAGDGDKVCVDLFRIVEAQLAEFGTCLRDTGGDTYADSKRFFSHRRDGKTGRHLSVIVAGRTA